MTENEAIKKHIEECEQRIGNILGFMVSNSDADTSICEENITVLKTAIQALEEIQQYRELGAVEEFKALKEKNEPKKAIFDNKDELCICPCCGKTVGEHQNYCWSCGQAFDT
ncbi:MAG: hypothetical protein IJA32_06585 [Lachnospiraceae bacterium]|nr:hypothetical protein [Lachnospiraceae bacterium]